MQFGRAGRPFGDDHTGSVKELFVPRPGTRQPETRSSRVTLGGRPQMPTGMSVKVSQVELQFRTDHWVSRRREGRQSASSLVRSAERPSSLPYKCGHGPAQQTGEHPDPPHRGLSSASPPTWEDKADTPPRPG